MCTNDIRHHHLIMSTVLFLFGCAASDGNEAITSQGGADGKADGPLTACVPGELDDAAACAAEHCADRPDLCPATDQCGAKFDQLSDPCFDCLLGVPAGTDVDGIVAACSDT